MIGGKAIVITGASSGIGRAAALALGRQKAKLFLVARREQMLRDVAEQVRGAGGSAFAQTLDLRHADSAEAMIRIAHEYLGRIDVLINNAAFGYFGSVENMPLEISREMFDLNFQTPLVAMQRVIPIMRKQGSGHIINISSVAGKRGLPLSGVYSATKFALNGLSEALRLELKGARIHVSVINPASTESEFLEAIRLGDVKGNMTPVGHVQTSEEVAACIVQCIRHPRAEVYPYSRSRIMAWANAIAPSLMDAIVLRSFRDRLKTLRSVGGD